jgi:hypothetical protein
VWDLHSSQTAHAFECETGGIEAVAVTPDGLRAVSASGDETLQYGTCRAAKCCACSKAIYLA